MHHSEAAPSDLGVPIVMHAGYVYCLSLKRWQVSMDIAGDILSRASKNLEQLCASGSLIVL